MDRTRWLPGRSPLLLTLLLLWGCGGGGGGGTGNDPSAEPRILVLPESGLADGLSDPVTFTARTVDDQGRTLSSNPPVTWESLDPGVATIDAGGRAAPVSPGVARIRASAPGTRAGTAELEVYVRDAGPYRTGAVHRGRKGYVEFIPGALPVILSAGHGGDEEPQEIPDRTYGTTVTDRNTRELTEQISDALFERTGLRPHVILSHLRRTKLDPNREIVEAAQGNRPAEVAWADYHTFVDAARDLAGGDGEPALYLDIHGHGHDIQRVELGYLLSGEDLRNPDATLNAPGWAGDSSIRDLAARAGIPFAELLRGPGSFGGLLYAEGYRAVPSPTEPDPGGDPYFSGGYSTVRHGSRDGGTVSGIQLEHHFDGVRDTQSNRAAYAQAVAQVILTYLEVHAGITF